MTRQFWIGLLFGIILASIFWWSSGATERWAGRGVVQEQMKQIMLREAARAKLQRERDAVIAQLERNHPIGYPLQLYVSPQASSTRIGDGEQFNFNLGGVTWASSNVRVATVDSDGAARCVGVGSAVIEGVASFEERTATLTCVQ